MKKRLWARAKRFFHLLFGCMWKGGRAVDFELNYYKPAESPDGLADWHDHHALGCTCGRLFYDDLPDFFWDEIVKSQPDAAHFRRDNVG